MDCATHRLRDRALDVMAHAMADPRLMQLLAEFADARAKLVMPAAPRAAAVAAALAALLDSVAVVLGDHVALQGHAHLATALDCVEEVRHAVTEHAPTFPDALAVLQLVCQKLRWAEATTDAEPSAEEVLDRVDDLLRMLGVAGTLSLRALWDAADEDLGREHRTLLWTGVSGTLTAVHAALR